MKLILFAFSAILASVGFGIEVPALPPPEYADTEASTNFTFVLTTASCDGRRVGDEQIAPAADKESVKEPKKKLSRAEMFEAEFRHVIDNTYSSISIKNAMASSRAAGKILNEVIKLPKDESKQILESFLDMTLADSPEPIVNFPSKYDEARRIYWTREAWFQKRFHVICDTFYTYMKVKEDPYEDWDRLCVFFEKCTNEFAMVSRCQPKSSGPKREYLLEFKDNYFKTFVHVVRDMDLKYHKAKPTEKQKAEIFRRFEELEEYVEKLVPPRKPWIEEQKMLNPQSTPPSPPPQNSNPKRFDGRYTM